MFSVFGAELSPEGALLLRNLRPAFALPEIDQVFVVYVLRTLGGGRRARTCLPGLFVGWRSSSGLTLSVGVELLFVSHAPT